MSSSNFKLGLHIFFIVLQVLTGVIQLGAFGLVCFYFLFAAAMGGGNQAFYFSIAAGAVGFVLFVANLINVIFLIKRHFWARVFAVVYSVLTLLINLFAVAALAYSFEFHGFTSIKDVDSQAVTYIIEGVVSAAACVACIIYWLLPVSGQKAANPASTLQT